MVKRIFLVFFLLLNFIFIPKAYAEGGEFATSYDVVYDIDSNGITTVTEKISLRNLTEQYYANQFKLTFSATQIFDITASDPGGSITATAEQKDASTQIAVKFNQQVVGLNKILPWTLQFKSKDFAEKLGKVWELRVPKVSSTTNLESYNLTITVPLAFGEPTAISPTPKSQTTESNKLFLRFEKSQLEQSGVSASFGKHQVFDFDLTYHLDNNNLVPILTNIALPPDTAYQDVIYQQITPAPLNITVDGDGNYLAWYRLGRSERLDIKLTGSVKLYTQSKVKNPKLELDLQKLYTQENKYWEKDHPKIQSKLAEILEDPSTRLPDGQASSGQALSNAEKARLIYHYVVNSLKYDSSRLKNFESGGIERFGAVTALNNPDQAVCMEFTDLFIALSRAAGIPARELDGFAYSANTALRPLSLTGDSFGTLDILHSWPEIWDDNRGWVMVDPTWENTTGGVDYFNKFDLNHVVFAIKGSQSERPVPAGSYKYAGEDSQDVKVNLSEDDFLGEPRLDVKIENANPILAGFPSKIKVKVANTGNAVYPSNNFLVTANKLSVLEGDGQTLGLIPAFGQANFDLNIRTKSLFDNFSDQIEVLIGSQKFSKDVSIKPFLIFQTYPLIAIGIVSLMGLIYLLILGAHIYKVRFAKKFKR